MFGLALDVVRVEADVVQHLPPAREVARHAGVIARRLQQLEKLDPQERRQLLQLVDAFIERGQLKKKIQSKAA